VKKGWELTDIKDMKGKTAVVTGANSGIGLEIVKGLAEKGCHVVMAVRDRDKGKKVLMDLNQQNEKLSLELGIIDLADIHSIGSFATEFKLEHDRLDLLINNAGVMNPPYTLTVDGFESQWGVNHLGHFVLTGALIDIIVNTENSRVVTQSSLARLRRKINFDNSNSKINYQPAKSYSQSKLANALFAMDLQRKFRDTDCGSLSLCCHPGVSRTNLFRHQSTNIVTRGVISLLSQPVADAALPALFAATHPELKGGEFIIPGGLMGLKGPPRVGNWDGRSSDISMADYLWNLSERTTGFRFEERLRSATCKGSCGK